jgi:hypothetical protein
MKENNMRQRDPNHERRLQGLLILSADDFKRQIGVSDYRKSDYVASEVLTTIIRLRHGQSTGVLDAATEEMHRRVVKMVEIHTIRRHSDVWRELKRNCSEVVVDAVSYFWTTLISDEQAVCNAEVRFAVYLQNKVDDYMRHLLIEENTRTSINDFVASDEDGDEAEFIDTVEDDIGESPETIAIKRQESEKINNALMSLLRIEQNAYYFRVECEYDWDTVAKFLGCSIPIARQHLNIGFEKLRGALA